MSMPYRTVAITEEISVEIHYDEALSDRVGEDRYVAVVSRNNKDHIFKGFTGVDEAEDFLTKLFEVKNEN